MRPFAGTMPLDEAKALIDRTIAPIERTERVRVLDASGRVLARDVAADADVPPFSRAAMDGYAVRAADTAGASRQSPVTLRCIEQTFTGQVPRQTIGPGQCSEVATGAPLPPGADAVVMVEETEITNPKAQIPNPNSQIPNPNSQNLAFWELVVGSWEVDSCLSLEVG
jgi:molybdopterin molybdotransferase